MGREGAGLPSLFPFGNGAFPFDGARYEARSMTALDALLVIGLIALLIAGCVSLYVWQLICDYQVDDGHG